MNKKADAWVAERRAALQQQLEEEVRSAHVLSAGEVLVFTLSIERHALVRSDDVVPRKTFAERSLPIGGKKPGKSTDYTKYVQAANLTETEIAEILKLFPPLDSKQMRTLLQENGNNPCKLEYGCQPRINRVLRGKKFGEKQYMLATYRTEFQLWEVE